MPIYFVFFRSSATFGKAARGPRDGLVWHREGRKMATRQYRSAFSLDDVAQKTTLARSAYRSDVEKTSKSLEERCGEFASLASVRPQGVKIIDVIERNRPPKSSVAFEPGDLGVDLVSFFSTFWRAPKGCFCTRRGVPLEAQSGVQDRVRNTECDVQGAKTHEASRSGRR